MFGKKIILLALSSILLGSCNSGNTPLGDSPMVVGIQCGDITFDIRKASTKKSVGTMEFMALEENNISIRFNFNDSFDESFVFTYNSKTFSIARRWEENETAEDKFFANYPYVEKSDSLHRKLSKIIYKGVTKTVLEGTSNVQMIALNGSGVLTFEYNTVFNPSKHFYVCGGTSFMPSGFSLCNKDGEKVDEGCHEWYYVSNKELFEI